MKAQLVKRQNYLCNILGNLRLKLSSGEGYFDCMILLKKKYNKATSMAQRSNVRFLLRWECHKDNNVEGYRRWQRGPEDENNTGSAHVQFSA